MHIRSQPFKACPFNKTSIAPKTSASPTNKYAITVVSDVLKSTTANIHEILRQNEKQKMNNNDVPCSSSKYAIEMVDTAEQ